MRMPKEFREETHAGLTNFAGAIHTRKAAVCMDRASSSSKI
jgi:hypothetical protein